MAQGVSGTPATLEVHVTGRRVLATIVDAIVFSVLSYVLALFFGTTAVGAEVGFSLGTFGSLLLFVLVFAYYIVLEGYLGQTLGKMLLSIKVVREDNGGLPGPGAATLRTILRIIDGIFFYLVAFITVQVSQRNKRLGDMVAKTLVVRK